MVTKRARRTESTPEWERFRGICRSQGRLPKWVAEQVGMNYDRLWKVLHGLYGYPRPEGFAAALADVLGVPVGAIFEEHPDDD